MKHPDDIRGNFKTITKADITSVVFGFGHRARTGKDTAVQHIVANRPEAKQYSFAALLKQEIMQAALSAGGMQNLWKPETFFYRRDGNFVVLPDWVVYEEDADMSDPMIPLGRQRTLMQWWGTEFRRAIEPDYWLDRLAELVAKEKPKVALISDVRFPNEKAWVDDHGHSIKIVRPGAEIVSLHYSEQALAQVPDHEWTAVLANDKSIEDFKKKVLRVYDLLRDENF